MSRCKDMLRLRSASFSLFLQTLYVIGVSSKTFGDSLNNGRYWRHSEPVTITFKDGRTFCSNLKEHNSELYECNICGEKIDKSEVQKNPTNSGVQHSPSNSVGTFTVGGTIPVIVQLPSLQNDQFNFRLCDVARLDRCLIENTLNIKDRGVSLNHKVEDQMPANITVQIPNHVNHGRHVLHWSLETDKTFWTNCADIELTHAESVYSSDKTNGHNNSTESFDKEYKTKHLYFANDGTTSANIGKKTHLHEAKTPSKQDTKLQSYNGMGTFLAAIVNYLVNTSKRNNVKVAHHEQDEASNGSIHTETNQTLIRENQPSMEILEKKSFLGQVNQSWDKDLNNTNSELIVKQQKPRDNDRKQQIEKDDQIIPNHVTQQVTAKTDESANESGNNIYSNTKLRNSDGENDTNKTLFSSKKSIPKNQDNSSPSKKRVSFRSNPLSKNRASTRNNHNMNDILKLVNLDLYGLSNSANSLHDKKDYSGLGKNILNYEDARHTQMKALSSKSLRHKGDRTFTIGKKDLMELMVDQDSPPQQNVISKKTNDLRVDIDKNTLDKSDMEKLRESAFMWLSGKSLPADFIESDPETTSNMRKRIVFTDPGDYYEITVPSLSFVNTAGNVKAKRIKNKRNKKSRRKNRKSKPKSTIKNNASQNSQVKVHEKLHPDYIIKGTVDVNKKTVDPLVDVKLATTILSDLIDHGFMTENFSKPATSRDILHNRTPSVTSGKSSSSQSTNITTEDNLTSTQISTDKKSKKSESFQGKGKALNKQNKGIMVNGQVKPTISSVVANLMQIGFIDQDTLPIIDLRESKPRYTVHNEKASLVESGQTGNRPNHVTSNDKMLVKLQPLRKKGFHPTENALRIIDKKKSHITDINVNRKKEINMEVTGKSKMGVNKSSDHVIVKSMVQTVSSNKNKHGGRIQNTKTSSLDNITTDNHTILKSNVEYSNNNVSEKSEKEKSQRQDSRKKAHNKLTRNEKVIENIRSKNHVSSDINIAMPEHDSSDIKKAMSATSTTNAKHESILGIDGETSFRKNKEKKEGNSGINKKETEGKTNPRSSPRANKQNNDFKVHGSDSNREKHLKDHVSKIDIRSNWTKLNDSKNRQHRIKTDISNNGTSNNDQSKSVKYTQTETVNKDGIKYTLPSTYLSKTSRAEKLLKQEKDPKNDIENKNPSANSSKTSRAENSSKNNASNNRKINNKGISPIIDKTTNLEGENLMKNSPVKGRRIDDTGIQPKTKQFGGDDLKNTSPPIGSQEAKREMLNVGNAGLDTDITHIVSKQKLLDAINDPLENMMNTKNKLVRKETKHYNGDNDLVNGKKNVKERKENGLINNSKNDETSEGNHHQILETDEKNIPHVNTTNERENQRHLNNSHSIIQGSTRKVSGEILRKVNMPIKSNIHKKKMVTSSETNRQNKSKKQRKQKTGSAGNKTHFEQGSEKSIDKTDQGKEIDTTDTVSDKQHSSHNKAFLKKELQSNNNVSSIRLGGNDTMNNTIQQEAEGLPDNSGTNISSTSAIVINMTVEIDADNIDSVGTTQEPIQGTGSTTSTDSVGTSQETTRNTTSSTNTDSVGITQKSETDRSNFNRISSVETKRESSKDSSKFDTLKTTSEKNSEILSSLELMGTTLNITKESRLQKEHMEATNKVTDKSNEKASESSSTLAYTEVTNNSKSSKKDVNEIETGEMRSEMPTKQQVSRVVLKPATQQRQDLNDTQAGSDDYTHLGIERLVQQLTERPTHLAKKNHRLGQQFTEKATQKPSIELYISREGAPHYKRFRLIEKLPDNSIKDTKLVSASDLMEIFSNMEDTDVQLNEYKANVLNKTTKQKETDNTKDMSNNPDKAWWKHYKQQDTPMDEAPKLVQDYQIKGSSLGYQNIKSISYANILKAVFGPNIENVREEKKNRPTTTDKTRDADTHSNFTSKQTTVLTNITELDRNKNQPLNSVKVSSNIAIMSNTPPLSSGAISSDRVSTNVERPSNIASLSSGVMTSDAEAPGMVIADPVETGQLWPALVSQNLQWSDSAPNSMSLSLGHNTDGTYISNSLTDMEQYSTISYQGHWKSNTPQSVEINKQDRVYTTLYRIETTSAPTIVNNGNTRDKTLQHLLRVNTSPLFVHDNYNTKTVFTSPNNSFDFKSVSSPEGNSDLLGNRPQVATFSANDFSKFKTFSNFEPLGGQEQFKMQSSKTEQIPLQPTVGNRGVEMQNTKPKPNPHIFMATNQQHANAGYLLTQSSARQPRLRLKNRKRPINKLEGHNQHNENNRNKMAASIPSNNIGFNLPGIQIANQRPVPQVRKSSLFVPTEASLSYNEPHRKENAMQEYQLLNHEPLFVGLQPNGQSMADVGQTPSDLSLSVAAHQSKGQSLHVAGHQPSGQSSLSDVGHLPHGPYLTVAGHTPSDQSLSVAAHQSNGQSSHVAEHQRSGQSLSVAAHQPNGQSLTVDTHQSNGQSLHVVGHRPSGQSLYVARQSTAGQHSDPGQNLKEQNQFQSSSRQRQTQVPKTEMMLQTGNVLRIVSPDTETRNQTGDLVSKNGRKIRRGIKPNFVLNEKSKHFMNKQNSLIISKGKSSPNGGNHRFTGLSGINPPNISPDKGQFNFQFLKTRGSKSISQKFTFPNGQTVKHSISNTEQRLHGSPTQNTFSNPVNNTQSTNTINLVSINAENGAKANTTINTGMKCSATGLFSSIYGMHQWCNTRCNRNQSDCPKNMCTCS